MATTDHTFLFSDLVGFTTLAAQLGDDHAAEVALQFHDRVRRLAAQHRAEEIKTIGDGVMLRGEDPALAVRLGLRIVNDLEEIPEFPLVRTGIHTGPAVERARDWYGTTVNVAARLCAAAGGGEVLVSEATCAAAGDLPRVELAERRLHWLKNVVEPVPAHLVHPREPTPCQRWRARARVLPRPHPRLETACP